MSARDLNLLQALLRQPPFDSKQAQPAIAPSNGTFFVHFGLQMYYFLAISQRMEMPPLMSHASPT